MNLTQVSVHLAISVPLITSLDDDPFYYDRFLLTLKELEDNSGIYEFPLFDLGTFNPEIKWGKSKSKRNQIEDIFPYASKSEYQHLLISIEVPYEVEEKADFWIREIVIKRISDLLILTNLCRSGLIELKESELIHNGKLLEYSPIPKMDGLSVQLAHQYSRQIKWPCFRTLKLINSWRWLIQRKAYLESEGFEKDPTSRALNAFSRLLESPTIDHAMHLVWAMVGIEALYVRGRPNVMQQVRNNVPKVLGNYELFKKEFDKMYDFRSRFIHGDLDFPGLYQLGDASSELAQYEVDLEKTVSFAVSILTGSLQEIISGKQLLTETNMI